MRNYLFIDTAASMNISLVVKLTDTFDASKHTDEEPVEEDDSAAVDTAGRASAKMRFPGVATAATDSSYKDSAASYSGIENLPAVCSNNETSYGAAVFR